MKMFEFTALRALHKDMIKRGKKEQLFHLNLMEKLLVAFF